MKPLKLTIEGVNSFNEAQELDFETVGRSDLFCISGKTGAGKTTIFDSIMLALYGKTGKGNLADVVNLSRNNAAVTLDFEAGGERYTVERFIKCRTEKTDGGTAKRTASAECTLYKGGAPIAVGSDAAAEIIRGVIGLAESEFKNVYLLEQGEYAEFLKKQPAKQLEAVGRIFSLMRFGDVYKLAGEKRKEAEEAVRATEQRIADVGDVSDERAREERAALTSLKQKRTAKQASVAKQKTEIESMESLRDNYLAAVQKQRVVAEHTARLELERDKQKSAEAELAAFEQTSNDGELAARIAELNDEAGKMSALSALDGECDAAEAEARACERALNDKLAAKAAAEETAKRQGEMTEHAGHKLGEKIGEFLTAAATVASPSDVLSRAAEAMKGCADAPQADAGQKIQSAYYELCAELTEYGGLRKKADERRDAADAARSAADAELKKTAAYNEELKAAQESRIELEQKVKAAADAVTAAQLNSQAAAIAAELHDGDACPVCGGAFHGGHALDVDVEKAKACLSAANAELEAADKKTAELNRCIDRAKSEYEHRAAEVSAAESELAELNGRIAALGVEPETHNAAIKILEAAKGLSEEYASALRGRDGALPALAAATAEAQGAKSALDSAEQKAAELNKKLGDMRGRAGAELMKLKSELSELTDKKSEIDTKRTELRAAADSAAAAVRTVEEMLELARRDMPDALPEFDEDAYRSKRAAYEAASAEYVEIDKNVALGEERLQATESALEKLKGLKAELKLKNKSFDMYKTIADMTKGKAMLNFVATEYIESFTAVASDILTSLSGGKYTIRYDRDNGFMVSDYLNGGKSRKTDTLSGGEMFLTSLAVSIAIARAVGGGAQDGFFFLDEGFGTLDDELIDTVYAALEELARSCLVGVISHSSALIDRMPSCVEVIEATDTSGSVIRY